MNHHVPMEHDASAGFDLSHYTTVVEELSEEEDATGSVWQTLPSVIDAFLSLPGSADSPTASGCHSTAITPLTKPLALSMDYSRY